MTTFFCMRHGLTDWNVESRIQGNTDTALNEKGRNMAREWAKTLEHGGLDLMVTSTLGRAGETGAIINETLDLPVIEDERLCEQDWGEWTGLTKKDLGDMRKLVRQQENKGFDFRPKGGESRNEVLMRVCDALIDISDDYPGKSILVVTHSGVLKCLAYALSGLDFKPGEPVPIKDYTLHRIECMEMELAIGELNMDL